MFCRRRISRVCSKRWILAVFCGFLLYVLFSTKNLTEGNGEDTYGKMPIEIHKMKDKTILIKKTKEGNGEDTYGKMPNEIHKMKDKTVLIKKTKAVKRTDDCDQWFGDDIDENVRIISQYPRGQAGPYLAKLGGNQTGPKQMMKSFPVIATAACSSFYGAAQGLLKNIHEVIMPKYPNITIIFYDFGLTPEQYKKMKQYCRCEIRKFVFDEMPSHVRNLRSYTWKPIIVKKLLMEFGWVWWMDSSIRFKTDQLDAPLAYSQENSVLFFTYDPVFAVALHTDVQTMDYLQEDRCKFRYFGETEAGFVLFHYDNVTRTIVDAWAACALNIECMSPPGTQNKLACNQNIKHDGRCHRFDQSVLSIALRRIFHYKNDYPLVDKPFRLHEVRRGESVNYFPLT